MTRTQLITFRLLLIAALAVITFLATTRQEYPVVKDISDKANHILAFYVLALLVDFSFPKGKLGFAKVSPLLGYGLLIEITQSFLPGRTASIIDLIADGVGIALYKLSLSLLTHVSAVGRRWTRQV